MSYSIRQLTRDDVDAYRAIRLEALTDHPESYGTAPQSFAARPIEALQTMLDRMAVFGVVTDSGALAGIVAYARDDGERETHRGREAITAWARDTIERYRMQSEPLETTRTENGHTVKARVTGDFPGSPLTFTYRFTLTDDAIKTLEIGL